MEALADSSLFGATWTRPASISTRSAMRSSALLTLFLGISVIQSDQLLVIGPDYVYKYNTTGWGWIHIALAIVLAAIAFGIFWGMTWARVSAILIAAISIVVMFLWLPYYPVWSIVVIALDVVVIWAIATWDADNAWRRGCLAIAGRRRFAVGYEAGSTPVSAGTRNESCLLVGSMILANTRSRNNSSPPAAWSNPSR